jgi:hypothetical protein
MMRDGTLAFPARIRESPTWLAMFLIPVTLTLHQWNPCDSTASVAAGDSLVHIGLCLAIGLLVALGKLVARPISPESHRDSCGRYMVHRGSRQCATCCERILAMERFADNGSIDRRSDD